MTLSEYLDDWRIRYAAQMIPLFYEYIQKNHATNYQVTWSQWKAKL